MKKGLKYILVTSLSLGAVISLGSCSTKKKKHNNDVPSGPTETVKKDIEGVVFNDASFRYDGNEHSIFATNLPQGVTATYINNKQTNAGEYQVTANLSGEGYNTLTITKKLTITKADITGVIFNGGTVNYDGQNHNIEIEGTLPTGVTVEYKVNGQSFTGASAIGTYEVVAHFVSTNSNYNDLADKTATLTIQSTASGATFTDKTATYNGSAQTISVANLNTSLYDVKYKVNDQEFTGATNVGQYNVTATIYVKNTTTAVETLTAKLTINKADITGIVFNDSTVDYNGQNQTITIQGTLPEGVTVEYKVNDQVFTGASAVGTYEVVAHFTNTNSNYNDLADKTATLTIQAAVTGATFTDKTETYDGNAKTIAVANLDTSKFDVKYFVNNQEFTEATNAGEYNVTATIYLKDTTTVVVTLQAKLTINKADITGIEFNDSTVDYNGQNQTIAIEGTLPTGVTVDYKVNDQAFTGATNAGTYEVVAHFTNTNPNYNDLADMTATLTINKIAVTGLLFENLEETYDGQAHTILLTGTLPEGISVAYTDNSKTNAGNYTAIATFTGTNANYLTPQQMTASLVINKQKISVDKFNSKQFTYGDENIELKYKLATGQVLPEGVSIKYNDGTETTSTYTKTNVGTYNVKLVLEDTNNNYELDKEYIATLTINKANITGITLTGATVNHDGQAHALEIQGQLPEGVNVEYTINGLPLGEVSDVGIYTFEAHFINNNPNYNDLDDMSATLEIKATASGASFSSREITYDGNVQSLEVTNLDTTKYDVVYTANGEVFTGATNAGFYSVTATIYTKGTTTVLETFEASLYIKKADVSGIIFENFDTTYNGTNQAFEITGTLPAGMTVEYTVDGETFTELKNAGAYVITATFSYTGTNYNVPDSKQATLTIAKATITNITFTDQTFKFDGQEHSLAITGTLPEGVTVSYSTNNSIKNYPHDTGYATETVVASFGVGNNYNPLANMTATLKVEKSNTVHQITYVKPNGSIVYGYVEHGQQADSTPVIASKTGYDIEWSDSTKIGSKYVFNNVQDDIKTICTYEHIKYSITYNNVDSPIVNPTSNPKVYYVDSEAIVFANPTRTGYVFDGWYDNALFTGDKITGITSTESNPITGNKELYAKWNPEEYTITLVVDEINWKTITVKYDSTFAIETAINALYEADYEAITDSSKNGGKVFYGWYKDFDGTDYANEVSDSFTWNVAEGATYYGYTKESIPSTVTFHLGNIVLGTNKTPYNTGTKVRLPQSISTTEFSSTKYENLYDSTLLKNEDYTNYFIKEWRSVDNVAYGSVTTETAWEYTGGDIDLFAVLAYINTGDEVDISDGVFKGVKGTYNPVNLIIPSYTCDGTKSTFTPVTQIGDGINSISIGSNTKIYSIGYNTTKIADNAFKKVIKAKSDLVLTMGVKEIGTNAFEGCTGVDNVYYLGTTEDWFNITFKNAQSNPFVDSNEDNRDLLEYNFTTNTFPTPKSDIDGANDPNFIKEEVVISSTSLTKISDYSQIGNLRIKTLDLSGCTNLTTIGKYAFAYCTNMESIILPESVTTIDEYAFAECTKLTSINLKNITTINEYAFYNAGLETLSITENLTQIKAHVFENNTNLTEVIIPVTTTSMFTNSFKGCTKLTTIKYDGTIGDWLNIYDGIKNSNILDNITNFKTKNGETYDAVTALDLSTYTGTSIGTEVQAFKNVTSIVLPSTLTTIKEGAFKNFTNITTIDLSNVTSIGKQAFYGCTNLKTITLAAGQTYDEEVFAGCTSLVSIELKSNVGVKMFKGCTSLQNVTFNNTVTSIGAYAFDGCMTLTEINALSVTSIGYGAFPIDSDNTVNITKLELGTAVASSKEPETDTSKTFAYMFGIDDANDISLPEGIRMDIVIDLHNGNLEAYSFVNLNTDINITIKNGTIKTGAFVCSWFISLKLDKVAIEKDAFDADTEIDDTLYILTECTIFVDGLNNLTCSNTIYTTLNGVAYNNMDDYNDGTKSTLVSVDWKDITIEEYQDDYSGYIWHLS